MTYIASRLAAVKPSASMAASLAAKALRAKGVDVIELGLGEPTSDTILSEAVARIGTAAAALEPVKEPAK